jgi:calnexin
MKVIALFFALIITATHATIFFKETFDTDPFESGKWVLSEQSKYAHQPVKVMASDTAPTEFKDDKGVQLTQDMKHYGFGGKFPTALNFPSLDEDLIVQYEVKLEETLNCGGAYIKLLRQTEDLKQLDNASPYTIMFGPDKCGTTNKVHFIVQYQNPITKQYEEKHFNETIAVRSDKSTHLYSLLLKKNGDFEISIDNKFAKSGSLLSHMHPSIVPPIMIDDPEDLKPADWVDAKEIVDETATKPDDWDETAPRKIPDPNAKKPEGWADDAPKQIPNPEAEKPSDWDDEEDGEWEAPLIDNPVCEKIGCGLWTPPLINNPAYKGKWSPPKIPNPAYIGEWKARQISNPAYFPAPEYPRDNLDPITALTVEVWTINGGIHFDNFIVGDKQSVQAFTEETFEKKKAVEKQQKKQETNEQRNQDLQEKLQSGTLLQKLEAIYDYIRSVVEENPMVLVGTIIAALIPIIFLFYSMQSSDKKSPATVSPATQPSPSPATQEPTSSSTSTSNQENDQPTTTTNQ